MFDHSFLKNYKTIPEVIAYVCDHYGEDPAFMYKGEKKWETLSFQDTASSISKWAEKLSELGVQKGDRVVLCAKVFPEWMMCMIAILKCEAAVVLFDPMLPMSDLKQLIHRSQPTTILIDTSCEEKFLKEDCSHKVVLNAEAGGKHIGNCPKKVQREHLEEIEVDPRAEIILFTSGTTGEFKGVMLSQKSVLSTFPIVMERAAFAPGQKVLSLLPNYHIYPLIASNLVPMCCGTTVCYVTKLARDEILEGFRAIQPHHVALVPRLVDALHQGIWRQAGEKGKKGTLKFLTKLCGLFNQKLRRWLGKKLFAPIHTMLGNTLINAAIGGAKGTVEVIQDFRNWGIPMWEGYGMTETSGVIAMHGYKGIKIKVGSVGLPLTNIEIKISNPDKTGEGEVLVRGDPIMLGYFRDPKATKEALTEEGWLRTGDLGYLDHDGYLYLTGRIKEAIVSAGGTKAIPENIEKRYRGVPGILDFAVVGMPSEKRTEEEVHAAVIIHESFLEIGRENAKKEIQHAILKKGAGLPYYQRIIKVHFVDQIPKTSTLKIRRHLLKQQLLKAKEKS